MDNPREIESKEYLEKHKILELFDNITASLVFQRPENPKEFMIQEIKQMKEARTAQTDYPCLFDDSNILSVYGMLDPTKKGFISLTQYKEALTAMGCKDFDTCPGGMEMDRISQDTFTREAKMGLKRASETVGPL
ncbi:EF-hand calcium-binding domain-containing protein 10-like [Anneissia japonica]|uniref:EF-hand calcium-binding domain-containing protein 10-like n=1 Tax=Anneissia japonica TaxID=1529436 RepID=UPI0014259257|nr:EF-hand calcium-binding domain-containing protein 10-like [Anneissia japonica]